MRDCARTQNKTQNSFPLVQKKILLGEGVTKASIPKVFIADFGAQNGHFQYDFWKKSSDFLGGNAGILGINASHLQKFALVSSLGNIVFFS